MVWTVVEGNIYAILPKLGSGDRSVKITMPWSVIMPNL